jgi:hypothetical protein
MSDYSIDVIPGKREVYERKVKILVQQTPVINASKPAS